MNFKAFMLECGFLAEAFDRPTPINWVTKDDHEWVGTFAVPVERGGGGEIRYQLMAQITHARPSWLRENTPTDTYDAGGPEGKGHYMLKLSFQRWSDLLKKWTHERPLEGEPKPQMSYVFATVLSGLKEVIQGDPKITAAYFVSFNDELGNAKGSSNARFSVYQRLVARYAPTLGFVRVPSKYPRDFLFVKKEYSTPKPLPTEPGKGRTLIGTIGSMLGKPEPLPA
jgi:hypothetical protein